MHRLAGAAVLLALIAAVYGATVGYGFVFDDRMLVIDNPLVREPPGRGLALPGSAAGGISYRPLRMLSYQVDHALAGGLAPGVFHASNLLYHLAAALALLGLARVTIGSEPGALAAAAIFAVHPLGSEAVAYVSGRRDLLCALFSLLALRAWWSFLSQGGEERPISSSGKAVGRMMRWRRPAALASSGACAALALAAKESAVVLPVLAALLLVLSIRRSEPSAARAVHPVALTALLAGVLATGLALYADRAAEVLRRMGGSLAPQPALSLAVTTTYLRLAVWPAALRADYRTGAFALPVAPFGAHAAVHAVALAGALSAGTVLLWRGAVAGLGLLWFLVCLLPVAQIVPYAEVVAEHNAYLALAGVALAGGDVVARSVRRWPRGALAAAVALIALLAARSALRAGDWRSDETLWKATLEVAPRSLRAHHNLGAALAASGRLLEARESFERAREIAPLDRDVMLGLAAVSGRLGDHARALQLAGQALEQARDAAGLTILGWAQLGSGDGAAARESFAEAVALGGRGDDLDRGLGLARRRVGRP